MFLPGRSDAKVTGTADEWAPLTPSSRNRKHPTQPTPMDFSNLADNESGLPRL